MLRLLKKFDTAKNLVPRPFARPAKEPTRLGAIYFGSTSPAMDEAEQMLAEHGIHLDLLRVRGFPFHNDVRQFIAEHDQVFVVEQNRDGQLRTLLVNELEIDPARLTKVLHFDGTPITAQFITGAIAEKVDELKVVPFRKAIP
jgi:2-oxoglutarate ferredoxin oxidoreductase subunit alpha